MRLGLMGLQNSLGPLLSSGLWPDFLPWECWYPLDCSQIVLLSSGLLLDCFVILWTLAGFPPLRTLVSYGLVSTAPKFTTTMLNKLPVLWMLLMNQCMGVNLFVVVLLMSYYAGVFEFYIFCLFICIFYILCFVLFFILHIYLLFSLFWVF